MDNSGINRTEFKGELYESIVTSLKETFANVYPGFEIEVKYKCERKESNNRYFYVYLKGETFGVRDEIPMLKPHLVFVDRYVNSDAILFSEHSRKKFEEVNEYSDENYDILRKGIEALQEEFKDRANLTRISVTSNSYSLQVEPINPTSPRYSSSSGYIHHYFNYSPISKKSAQSAISKIRSEIKYRLERK